MSYPTEDPTFIMKKWSGLPLPASGLVIKGSYGFSSMMPTGAVYFPNGISCAVTYTVTPADLEDYKLQITKVTQKPKAQASAETDLVFKNKTLTFEVEATVGPKEMADKVTWETPDIGSSAKTEKSSGDKKKGIAKLKVTYKGLPENNSDFGTKTLKAKCEDIEKEDTKDVRIFFSRDGKDHPGEDSGKTRNWFHYWKQGGASAAVPQLDQFEFMSKTIGGGYNPANKKLEVDATAIDSIPARSETVTGCSHTPGTYSYTFNRESVKDIQAVAAIVAHELMHKQLFEGSTTENDRDGDAIGEIAEKSVLPVTCYFSKNEYPDKPSCSNTYQLSADLFFGSRGDLKGAKKKKEWDSADKQLKEFGDNEIKAIHAEQSRSCDTSKDWAFPGSQAGK